MAATVKPRVSSENLDVCYTETSATSQEKQNLTELRTELGIKMTLMLGDKREAPTAGEREVLLKDVSMEGIHAC